MNKFTLFILAILVFSSCEKNTLTLPYRESIVKGMVVDGNKNPIEGVKITRYYEKPNPQDEQDDYIVLSDKEGKFTLECKGQDGYIFENIDGKENGGEFESRTILINSRYVKWEEEERNYLVHYLKKEVYLYPKDDIK